MASIRSTMSARSSRTYSQSRLRRNRSSQSIQDLIAAARDNPGKLTYGHAGTGTIPHLAVENFAEALKLKFQPVPFRGDAPVLPTLLKGDIDFGASAISTIHGQNFRPLLIFWQAAARRLSGCTDCARAWRDQRRAARPQRHLCAEGTADRNQDGVGARIAPMRSRARSFARCIANTGQSIALSRPAPTSSAQTTADYQVQGRADPPARGPMGCAQ